MEWLYLLILLVGVVWMIWGLVGAWDGKKKTATMHYDIADVYAEFADEEKRRMRDGNIERIRRQEMERRPAFEIHQQPWVCDYCGSVNSAVPNIVKCGSCGAPMHRRFLDYPLIISHTHF